MKNLAQGRERLSELGLEHAAAILADTLQSSMQEKSDYVTFLLALLDYERGQRQRRNLEVRTKLAHLPYRKTMEESG